MLAKFDATPYFNPHSIVTQWDKLSFLAKFMKNTNPPPK